MSMQGWQALHSLSRDSSVKERRLAPGTARRVVGYARPFLRRSSSSSSSWSSTRSSWWRSPLLLKDSSTTA